MKKTLLTTNTLFRLAILLVGLISVSLLVFNLNNIRSTKPRADTITVRPTAEGSTGWTPVGCTVHYQCVDEANLLVTDLVMYPGDGLFRADWYNTSWAPPSGSIINSVIVKVVAKGDATGVLQIRLHRPVGGGWFNQCYVPVTISTNWDTYSISGADEPCRLTFDTINFPIQIGVSQSGSFSKQYVA